ncbi:SDR family oxidoreductase [Cytophaga aurantiaca]|uniref:SDR family oxidoreductase n=1 Tax=Cytophaga aurantiaca TaxID=29530 RepID=UPI00036452EE|nr:SDR family oxidoreductase [Cytophaga aurantiaca]
MILKDKVIIVTGGSGLLGKAIMNDLKEKGAIAVNVDIKEDVGSGHHFVHGDTTDEKSIALIFETVHQKFGQIHGLVNNAYPRTADWGKPFEEDTDLTSWRKNVDLQLNSYVACCQEYIKYAKPYAQGSIVNMASIYGVVGNDFTVYNGTEMKPAAAYSAIKGGLINFSRYLASFYGKNGIRVNVVSPGGIFDHQNPIFVKNYEDKVPLKRMGTPEDIAPSVSFLLSDEAKYITGHNLMVDGGWTAI